MKYEGFQATLGSVLGRFGVDLGSTIINNHWLFKAFVTKYVFEEDKAWKRILDGSWVEFDAQKGPNRCPHRTQNGIKTRSQNQIGF